MMAVASKVAVLFRCGFFLVFLRLLLTPLTTCGLTCTLEYRLHTTKRNADMLRCAACGDQCCYATAGDPWAAQEKGWSGGDTMNCSLPNPATGKYGPNCTAWDTSKWLPGMQPYAALIRANNPSGNPGVNFMGGIHPR